MRARPVHPPLPSSTNAVVLLGLLVGLAAPLVTASASAAPEAHILRIDPRAREASGEPLLTTVVEIVQAKRMAEVLEPCAQVRGEDARMDCYGRELERPHALYTPFLFPESNAIFTVAVDGMDQPARFVSKGIWGESQGMAGVGTAWLIVLDADERMGPALKDAQQVARAFVSSLGPYDLVDVMVFNDRQVLIDSKWLSTAQSAQAESLITSVRPQRAQGRSRSLFSILKTAASDAFRALAGQSQLTLPLHQAMVVLSSGYGGNDPTTTGPGALQLSRYLTDGRFGDDAATLPKLPVPVTSIYFPHKEIPVRQNSLDFMQNLANPEIGGFFTVMRAGAGGRASAVVSAVRTRFSKMHIVKWRVPCLEPSVTQTFRLVFNGVTPPVLGDASFKDAVIGTDPTAWPIDVHVKYTKDAAAPTPVRPGRPFRVYGSFCWGSDKGRAEAYFLPFGYELPAALSSTDPEQARLAEQRVLRAAIPATTLETTDVHALFRAPWTRRILHGSGRQAFVRIWVFDNKTRRTSGLRPNRIIQLRAAGRFWPRADRAPRTK
ncbi:MAG: hypothetical protein JW940_13955 [Polyangiaceae bacterium]|nr:hypothetical protein [Polyangiaceae bacterium]